MRSFIRHPSDIPIEYKMDDNDSGAGKEHLHDIGHGGLAFSSPRKLAVGAPITIRISHLRPAFEVEGRVAWCRKEDGGFTVGVSFLQAGDRFRVRMVEQVCHIEHYKSEVLETEGRLISGEQAACEWIDRYAGSFPVLDDDEVS
ncbi:PilZ domain-containing protein [Thiogranum longum]|uniref:PilZ domain-containing protein n=1 Tax=Thiogranum longum TaxID=1537524 RepID=A0A4R1H9S5_9GAMM|nr:PilZ domain-containing protein [Thiogranum longum]TCK17233.1 PilZ domain-containing protein [Thiogranum longum]